MNKGLKPLVMERFLYRTCLGIALLIRLILIKGLHRAVKVCLS